MTFLNEIMLSDGGGSGNKQAVDSDGAALVKFIGEGGLATETAQATGNASLASIDGKLDDIAHETGGNLDAIAASSAAVEASAASIDTKLTGVALDGTDATGTVMPAGGVGIRGWLSSMYVALEAIYTKLTTSIAVTGTFWPATQPISAASLPLPSGASTSALQTTANTSLSAIATSVAAATPAGTNLIGKVGIDQTTPGTTNGVSATNFPTTLATNSGDADANTIRVVQAANIGTWQKGQIKIAATGTAVQLSATSYVLKKGLTITANTLNNSVGGAIGSSSVNNTVDGSGNGDFIFPGQPKFVPPGVNLNTIYLNGVTNDAFSFSGM